MFKSSGYLLIILLLILSLSPSIGQKRTYSPFSRYGLGELVPRGFGQSEGMAGAGIGVRSNEHLNNLNPASYSAMDSLSFFMEAGLTGFVQSFKSDIAQETFNNIDFSYFAMGFPISRSFFGSLGVKPFSNAGYNFEFSDETTLNRAIGTGNLSSAYGGVSFKPIPNFSLGAHATYLFGNLQHTSFVEFPNDPSAYKYGLQTEIHASDFFFDFGLQYNIDINPSNKIIIGATFRPKTSINGDFQKTSAKGFTYAEDGKLFTSNILIPQASDTSDVKGFDLPASIGVGISYNMGEKLLIAADYATERWGSAGLMESVTSVTNSSRLSAGTQFIPNPRSNSYLGTVRYRAGVRYSEDYIKLNGYQLKDFGISFGVGLPLSRTKTSINLSFEAGKRSTSQATQLEENYGKIKLNFTFFDIWFVKRKFD